MLNGASGFLLLTFNVDLEHRRNVIKSY